MPKCPNCGSTAYHRNGYYMTRLRGKSEPVKKVQIVCKACGRRYMLNPEQTNNPKCPYCEGKTKKDGFNQYGEQKYQCTKCHKHFQDGARAHRLTEHQKKMAVIYAQGGYSIRFIAKLLGMGATSVKRLIDKGT